MLGRKIYKNEFDEKLYKAFADWCNENNCTIEDKGDFYEVVKVDTTEDDLNFKRQNIQNEISSINVKLSELSGVRECAITINGVNQYELFKDGTLITMNETELQQYVDELTNKRSELLKQYKEL